MNPSVKMIVFVILLGAITSVLLLGADALTQDRIIANQEFEILSTILDAYDESYTTANINEVFETTVDTITSGDYTFYVHKATGAVSFLFEGGGVWGPIIGVLTLESDFETILRVAVLEQEETPGLGGIVATRNYLDTLNGIKMVPELIIAKDPAPNLDNEVDAITGATRTSTAFQNILNNAYSAHKSAWDHLG
jgi:Na+-transporting NADH:ubiquinone oxidoreductase subunit C